MKVKLLFVQQFRRFSTRKSVASLFFALTVVAGVFFTFWPLLFGNPVSYSCQQTDNYCQADYDDYCRTVPARNLFAVDNRINYCYNDSGRTTLFVQLTNWTDLEACAVITAATHNRGFGICVLQLENVFISETVRKKFGRFSNIQIWTLDSKKLFQGTALMNWYDTVCLSNKNQKLFVMQFADGVRFVYLFKYGGIYLDTDVFTLKSMENLSNTAALHDEKIINNAVLAFDKGNDFLAEIIESFPSAARPNIYGMTSYCLMAHLHKVRRKRFKMLGGKETWIRVLPNSAFYPYYYWAGLESSPFFAFSHDQAARNARNSYAIHLYRSMNSIYWKTSVQPDKDSFVGKIIEKYCS